MAKILIYSPNRIGKSMAGAAIRSWEFAKALSKNHQIVLLTPGPVEIQVQEFEIVTLASSKAHFKDAQILITQRLTVPLAAFVVRYKLKVIIDAYDPSPFELLEMNQPINPEITTLILSFKMADAILCANERQRELWIGFLLGQKLLSPIAIVPFGLPQTPPLKNGRGLKEQFGFNVQDKIILWGGGIWNWFDPLTLIRAMKIISSQREDVKLVFMGVKSPDPSIPSMSMANQAIQLARNLDLEDKNVFFHHGWVPYEERQNFLLDADIGVSTHFNHLETHFSFRTRLLDYLWAQLPMIVTTGDVWSEWISKHGLGRVVPYQDENAIAEAILGLLNQPKILMEIKENINIFKSQFYWENTLAPLHRIIERLLDCQPTKKSGVHLAKFLLSKIKERGFMHCLKKCGEYVEKRN